jgi:hypothetical protein
MLELILAFVAGTIVMDFAWAYRLGIPQVMLARWKYRKILRSQPQPNLNQEQQ